MSMHTGILIPLLQIEPLPHCALEGGFLTTSQQEVLPMNILNAHIFNSKNSLSVSREIFTQGTQTVYHTWFSTVALFGVAEVRIPAKDEICPVKTLLESQTL